jgi:hypothetical protein
MGIDMLFANVPKNLRVPRISTSSSDVLVWNKQSAICFEVLSAFTNANLHDDGIIVFVHTADPNVSMSIHNWMHTEDFNVAKGWFGIKNLDLQLPTNHFEVVNPLSPSSPLFFLRLLHDYISKLSHAHFVQTCKFLIKVFIPNESVLNVCTLDFKKMDYILIIDGWFNSFT